MTVRNGRKNFHTSSPQIISYKPRIIVCFIAHIQYSHDSLYTSIQPSPVGYMCIRSLAMGYLCNRLMCPIIDCGYLCIQLQYCCDRESIWDNVFVSVGYGVYSRVIDLHGYGVFSCCIPVDVNCPLPRTGVWCMYYDSMG